MPLQIAANLTMMFNEHEFMDRFAAAAKSGFTGVGVSLPVRIPGRCHRRAVWR